MKKLKKNPLYLFSPLELASKNGLNLNKTYENIFNHISKNYEEIDVKIHPSCKIVHG